MDDPEQRLAEVGEKVTVTLLKTEDDHYLIERFAECSAEFDSMQRDYQSFSLEEKQRGVTEQRIITEHYFRDRLDQLQMFREMEKDSHYGWRKLSDVIATAGSYIRVIRPISGSFNE